MKRKTILNKGLTRLTVAALALLLSLGLVSDASAAVQVTAGSKVQVKFVADVSSKFVKPGDEVEITLESDIDIGGVVIVEKGANGSARITSVQAAGKGGKPGFLKVELIDLQPKGEFKPEGDKPIMLSAVTEDGSGIIAADGKGRKLLSYLLIFGLFIKGSEAEIPTTTTFEAIITEDVWFDRE
ncbi:MAG: hypothetical protein ABII79_12035 [bacterium]